MTSIMKKQSSTDILYKYDNNIDIFDKEYTFKLFQSYITSLRLILGNVSQNKYTKKSN